MVSLRDSRTPFTPGSEAATRQSVPRHSPLLWPAIGVLVALMATAGIAYAAEQVLYLSAVITANPTTWVLAVSFWGSSILCLAVLQLFERIPPTTTDAARRTYRGFAGYITFFSVLWWLALVFLGAASGAVLVGLVWGYVVASPTLILSAGVISMGFTRTWRRWIAPVAVAVCAAVAITLTPAAFALSQQSLS